MTLTAGTRLGSYIIEAPLGAGGMGEVYRARDSKLQRQVALKVLPELLASDPDRRSRFEREAQLLAAFNHPHIAQIYGTVDTNNGAGAIVMELVEGATLSDRIAQGPLPLGEASGIASQIVAALDAAHSRGIIHRDLKPANIKITTEGSVKVLDFGLAKTIGLDSNDAVNADAMNSPTFTSPGTAIGLFSAPRPTWPPSRRVERRSTSALTSGPLAASSLKCSRDDACSMAPMYRTSSLRCCERTLIGQRCRPTHLRPFDGCWHDASNVIPTRGCETSAMRDSNSRRRCMSRQINRRGRPAAADAPSRLASPSSR